MKRRPERHHGAPLPGGPHAPQPHPHEEGEQLYGLRAGLAVFARRPDDILRVAFSHTVQAEIAALARWAASRQVPCAEVPDSGLDRMAQSTHHEGLILTVRPRRWTTPKELADVLATSKGAAVAFDRVRNPHNIGAILRSAAFFGLDAALLGAPAPHPALAPAAVRVAEGGVEHLRLARTTDLADTLARLRARGVHVVGADGHAPTDAAAYPFPRPAVLVLGNEREGLGDRVRAQCDAVVAIRGAGAVESLNVAVAAGVLISEMARKARV